MTITSVVKSSSKLAKTPAPVRDLAARLERAAQSRNEKVARADAEYVDACKRAIAALEVVADDTAAVTDETSAATEAAS